MFRRLLSSDRLRQWWKNVLFFHGPTKPFPKETETDWNQYDEKGCSAAVIPGLRRLKKRQTDDP